MSVLHHQLLFTNSLSSAVSSSSDSFRWATFWLILQSIPEPLASCPCFTVSCKVQPGPGQCSALPRKVLPSSQCWPAYYYLEPFLSLCPVTTLWLWPSDPFSCCLYFQMNSTHMNTRSFVSWTLFLDVCTHTALLSFWTICRSPSVPHLYAYRPSPMNFLA